MDEYDLRIATIASRMKERISTSPSDGLLVMILRYTMGWYLIIWSKYVYIPILRQLKSVAKLVVKHCTRVDPNEHNGVQIYSIAIDLYKLTMSISSIVLYFLCWLANDHSDKYFILVMISIILIFVVGRIAELVSVLTLLFLSPISSKKPSFRPVVNTFWRYIDISILFSVVYSCLCIFSSFSVVYSSGKSANDSPFTLVYFSFITLATIGYGDIVPAEFFSRLVVCIESFIGLFLIVAILQSTLGRTVSVSSEKSAA
jgi:hypothetical protein